MRLKGLYMGVLEDTGEAVLVGVLHGTASETRARWDTGFSCYWLEGILHLGVHEGFPQEPIRSLTGEKALNFVNAVLDHGGTYRAITCVRWIPEREGSGWVTAFSPDPLHDVVVKLSLVDVGMFKNMKVLFENDEDLDRAGVS